MLLGFMSGASLKKKKKVYLSALSVDLNGSGVLLWNKTALKPCRRLFQTRTSSVCLENQLETDREGEKCVL